MLIAHSQLPADREAVAAAEGDLPGHDGTGGPAETIVPELTGPLARLWLDAERASLVAIVAYAARHGWPGHAIRLAETLFRYLDGGYHAEALAVYTGAVQAAHDCGDHVAQIRNLDRIASLYSSQARYPQAIGLYRRALAAAQEVDDRSGKLLILGDIGNMRLLPEQARAHRYLASAYRTDHCRR